MNEDLFRCDHCRYWQAFPEADKDGNEISMPGECRRHPPVIIPQHYQEWADEEMLTPGAWPETHPDNWCGEFAPRLGLSLRSGTG